MASAVAIGSFLCLRAGEPPAPLYRADDEALSLIAIDGIAAADRDLRSIDGVKAVVVPHHAIAARSIALGVKALASSSTKAVIVVSPDHYGRCPKMICTTEGSYKTFFGDVAIDTGIVAELERSGLVARSGLFEDEHGVYTIAPYIKHYLPDAEIVPVAISQKSMGSEAVRNEIRDLLGPLLERKDVALVVSSDFSHYLPLAETEEMDRKTQASLCSGEGTEILGLQNPSQSDCPLCLWILEQEAQALGFWNPTLLAHTNSAELMRDASAKELTSHFAFAFPSHPSPEQEKLCYAIPHGTPR